MVVAEAVRAFFFLFWFSATLFLIAAGSVVRQLASVWPRAWHLVQRRVEGIEVAAKVVTASGKHEIA